MGLYLPLQTICNKGLKTFSLLTGIESSIAKMYILMCIFFVEIAVFKNFFLCFWCQNIQVLIFFVPKICVLTLV